MAGRTAAAVAASAAARHQRMLDTLTAGKRWCPRCSSWQPLAAFAKDATRPSGLAGWCRTCSAAYCRGWRRANRRAVLWAALLAAASAERTTPLARECGWATCPRCGATLAPAAFPASRTPHCGWCRDCTRAARTAAMAGTGTLAEVPPGSLRGWLLRCCGGHLADDGEASWWVAHHRRDCPDTWQRSALGRRANEAGQLLCKDGHAATS
jgi:hypothetical protein